MSRARLVACLLALSAAPAAAQTGDGTTAAAVLQLAPGARAAGMGAAYAAAADVDAVFYNPAAVAWQTLALSVSYQRHVDEIGFGSVAGALRLGSTAVAFTFGFLDYGAIAELVPDPAFGGQRGEETGVSVTAAEVVTRASVGRTLAGGRAAVGASAGLLWVGLAESGRAAPVFDAGVQYRPLPPLTVAAALRNAGPALRGARLAPGPLPAELRGGARLSAASPVAGVHVEMHGDVVAPLHHGTLAAAVGAEVGVPTGASGPVARLRAGYNGTGGDGAVGRFAAGAGLSFDRLSVDYAFQPMDVLGAVHRIGVRWSR